MSASSDDLLGAEIDLGRAGHVVEDDRDADGRRDGLEMGVQLAPGQGVVERRDHHHAGGAHRLGPDGQLDSLARTQRSRVRDDRDAAAGGLDEGPGDGVALLEGQRRELTGAATRDEPVDAGRHQPIGKRLDRRE